MEDTRKECPWCKSKVIQKGASKCPRCHEYIEWKRMGKGPIIFVWIVALAITIGTGGLGIVMAGPLALYLSLKILPRLRKNEH